MLDVPAYVLKVSCGDCWSIYTYGGYQEQVLEEGRDEGARKEGEVSPPDARRQERFNMFMLECVCVCGGVWETSVRYGFGLLLQ